MGELEQMKEFSRVYEKVKTLVQHSKSYIQVSFLTDGACFGGG
jgi:hypothetical protein